MEESQDEVTRVFGGQQQKHGGLSELAEVDEQRDNCSEK